MMAERNGGSHTVSQGHTGISGRKEIYSQGRVEKAAEWVEAKRPPSQCPQLPC